mgnify:CR=1
MTTFISNFSSNAPVDSSNNNILVKGLYNALAKLTLYFYPPESTDIGVYGSIKSH